MSEVASKELCLELYEKSGWEDVEYAHATYTPPIDPPGAPREQVAHQRELNRWDYRKICPAYDLSYLLRKLESLSGEYTWGAGGPPNGYRFCVYRNHGNGIAQGKADTPEDAACKLAIELLKQGVLTRDAA